MKKAVLSLGFILTIILTIYGQLHAYEWNERQRPAGLISAAENGIYNVSNIRWGFDNSANNLEPRWRNASIDVNKVKDVIFFVKPFPPEWLAAHCLLLFEFSEPAVATDKNEKSSGFILSIEARLQKGQKYSLLKGNFGEFFIVYQLGSKEDYLQYCAVESKILIPYKLKLSHEQKVQMLKNVIEESVKNRDNEKYNTINNSCTNNLFLLLNTVLPKEQQFKEWTLKKVIYNLGISFPRTAGKMLKKHGVVEEELPIINTGVNQTNAIAAKISVDNLNSIVSKNISNEEFSGNDKVIRNLQAKTDKLKESFINAINDGTLTREMIKDTMYDEDAEQLMGLFIPGIKPLEEDTTGFVIGKEFAEKLNSINNAAELSSYMSQIFDSYNTAIAKRLKIERNDVSQFIDMNIMSLSKGLEKSVKHLKLNQ